jgi:hypothetical protein
MSSSEKPHPLAQESAPTKPQEDLWFYRHRQWSSGTRWLVLSTVAHVLLLGLLATFTLTLAHRRPERIKIIPTIDRTDLLEEQLRQAAEQPPEEFEGEPSLKDLPGVLDFRQFEPKEIQNPVGPPDVGELRDQRPLELTQPAAVEPRRIPHILEGPGPEVIMGGMAQDGTLADLGLRLGEVSGGGGEFGHMRNALIKVGLDVVLVIDATDSMQFVTDSVKARLLKFIAALRTMVPTSRIGIVVYRDQGEEYVTRWSDLSFSTPKLQDFVSNLRAAGGGDWPEAVYDGLSVAINDLRWRKEAKRVIIVVPGSPPHPESVGKVLELARGFHAQGGVVSVLDLAEKMHEDFERAISTTRVGMTDLDYQPTPLPGFYQEFRNIMSSIAQAGGGEFIALTEDKALIRQIVILTFGVRWQEEMKKFLRDLE